MSRRVLLECDWRGCKHKLATDASGDWPAGWAEFQITLSASGPMPEGWRRGGDGRNDRSVVVCPDHVSRMFRGVPGQQDEHEDPPALPSWTGQGGPERA